MFKTTGNSFSMGTILRAMKKLNFKYGKIKFVHNLSIDNKERRLEYCKQMTAEKF